MKMYQIELQNGEFLDLRVTNSGELNFSSEPDREDTSRLSRGVLEGYIVYYLLKFIDEDKYVNSIYNAIDSPIAFVHEIDEESRTVRKIEFNSPLPECQQQEEKLQYTTKEVINDFNVSDLF